MFLTEDIITSIKARTLFPVSQNTFDETALALIIREVITYKTVPNILAVREDFFLTTKTTAIVGNVPYYALPERALGNALKDLNYLDSSGNRAQLTKCDATERNLYLGTGSGTTQPTHFYFEGDEVRLLPTHTTSKGSLEFLYYQKPNQIIATTSCAKITSISSAAGTTTFTVNTDLTASLSVGTKVDFVSATSPFLLWAKDVSITAITATTIAVATTNVSNEASTVEPVANDYICPAKFTNIPQVPEEFHPLIAQDVCEFLMEALGHMDKLQAVKLKSQEMWALALKLIANRVEAQPQVIKNRNGFC